MNKHRPAQFFVLLIAVGLSLATWAMAAEDGNQSGAAKWLGISERALRYKLAKFRWGSMTLNPGR